MKFRRRLCIFLLSFLTISCVLFFPEPHQAELQATYERSETVISEARKSLDTSRLSEVYTQSAIEAVEKDLAVEKEMAEENPIFIGEEIEVDWVEVIEYAPPDAIIKVKYFYRRYTYNRETGEIKYHDQPHRYWRIVKYQMRQEDGNWKIDDALEFVDWSG